MNRSYLFSIDLEDVRFRMPDGLRYAPRVPETTRHYLDFLAKHGFESTFFTTGDVARAYPELIREIVAAGHEIGCHTDTHRPLYEHTPASFEADLRRNIESLEAAGATDIRGFRAPYFSLTRKVPWAHGVLKKVGFTYSSSILPSPSPIAGWPGFGTNPREVDGILEVPVTLLPIPGVSTPYAGGVYFRVLPTFVLRRLFARSLSRTPFVVGYFHPYDIDTEQERFMFPNINENRLFNHLLYMNRGSVFPKLERLAADGIRFVSFKEFLAAGAPSL